MSFELNPSQKEAVSRTDGPLLIIAGAGSGKTKTLVERIANIISLKKAFPYEIMAVTFTNKAAGELTERIVAKVGEAGRSVISGTFHSICSKILRKNADRIGYMPNFVIYDTDDKLKVVKKAILKNNLSTSYFPVKKISAMISGLKNRMIYPDRHKADADDFFSEKVNDIYRDYQKELERCNAFDFDDLLCMTVHLFEKNEDVLFEYRNRVKYICVDEYQDTNYVQDRFVSLLSALYENVCAVGDDDQSIYSWRGADINNILSFQDRHKNCAVIHLEENYRSTSNILSAANSVIKKNTARLGKVLFTKSGKGEKVGLISCGSDSEEGRIVSEQIAKLVQNGHSYNEICVLYRTNSQSRVIEENLRRTGLPYTIVGGLKFYERKEIKDMTAYLRLILNRNDNVSFDRIVNFPPRGIGKKTLEEIKLLALNSERSYFDALVEFAGTASPSASTKKINSFIGLIESLSEKIKYLDAHKISEEVLKGSGLAVHYSKQPDASHDNSRTENLYEFLNGVYEFVKYEQSGSLTDFLSSVSLLSDIDSYNDRDERIVLMTVHSAKGLEYDTVFITGVNEGLFPYIHPGETANIEEERRLFYVAVTRARKKLFISTYRSRSRYFGPAGSFLPSNFIDDIPKETLDMTLYEKYDIGRLIFDKHSKYGGSAVNEPDLSEKDLVYSKQFGEGLILSVEVSGGKKVVTVDFDEFGIKKLLVRYADLRKL